MSKSNRFFLTKGRTYTTTKVKYVQGDPTKYEDLLSACEDTD
jgi:hypothetical protein